MTSKSILRVQALRILTSLPKERRAEAAIKAYTFLTEKVLDSKDLVVSFASKPLEINLEPFNRLLITQRRLALPRPENGTLRIYEVQSLEQIKHGPFRILEPDPSVCREVAPEEIGRILVPGLGFDGNRRRVGYGKGYFDKFLSGVPSVPKWGIGFLEQRVAAVPHDSWDVQLDELFLF